MKPKFPSKKQIEHWLFDPHPGRIDSSPFHAVSPVDVRRFLELSGTHHNAGYFQYTNEASLAGIFRNATLHLTLGRALNDKVEFMTCDPASWSRTYIASFSFGAMENIALWSMYGQPPEKAVRISFSKPSMMSIREAAGHVENLRIAIPSKKDGVAYRPIPEGIGIEFVSLHDVIYQYGRERVSEDGKARLGTVLWNRRMGLARRCSAFADCTRCPDLATYVKDVLWAGEFEVRLVIRLTRPLPFPNKTIAVNFPRTVFDGVSVMVGPMTTRPDQCFDRIGRCCSGLPVTNSAFRAVYKSFQQPRTQRKK